MAFLDKDSKLLREAYGSMATPSGAAEGAMPGVNPGIVDEARGRKARMRKDFVYNDMGGGKSVIPKDKIITIDKLTPNGDGVFVLGHGINEIIPKEYFTLQSHTATSNPFATQKTDDVEETDALIDQCHEIVRSTISRILSLINSSEVLPNPSAIKTMVGERAVEEFEHVLVNQLDDEDYNQETKMGSQDDN